MNRLEKTQNLQQFVNELGPRKLDDAHQLLDDERKHLEGLLKDRFNFYVLLELVIIFGSYQVAQSDGLRFLTLVLGAVISWVLLAGIWRTHSLVQYALQAVRFIDYHPYKRFFDLTSGYDANKVLILIPFVLTGYITVLAVLAGIAFFMPGSALQFSTWR